MKHIIAMSLAACALVACTQNNGSGISTEAISNPATAAAARKIDATQLPVLKFDKTAHDFGTITEGEKVSFAFKFTNTGKTDLIIQSASGSCGCTVPEFPRQPIKPGETEYIKAIFDSQGRSGTQTKEITVFANTIPNMHKISITSVVNRKAQ
jgi:hypothetical protein